MHTYKCQCNNNTENRIYSHTHIMRERERQAWLHLNEREHGKTKYEARAQKTTERISHNIYRSAVRKSNERTNERSNNPERCYPKKGKLITTPCRFSHSLTLCARARACVYVCVCRSLLQQMKSHQIKSNEMEIMARNHNRRNGQKYTIMWLQTNAHRQTDTHISCA